MRPTSSRSLRAIPPLLVALVLFASAATAQPGGLVVRGRDRVEHVLSGQTVALRLGSGVRLRVPAGFAAGQTIVLASAAGRDASERPDLLLQSLTFTVSTSWPEMDEDAAPVIEIPSARVRTRRGWVPALSIERPDGQWDSTPLELDARRGVYRMPLVQSFGLRLQLAISAGC